MLILSNAVAGLGDIDVIKTAAPTALLIAVG
jgi:hypothetical protein